MRARLSPEEREARRRERARFSFSSAAYNHYDPEVDGWGTPEDWVRIAEKLFGTMPVQSKARTGDKLLDALGLSALPTSLTELTTAFRAAMFKAHPDYGGTNAAAREVLEAYAILKRRVK